MISTRPDDSTILKLRVKGSNLDPLALRGRLQNLLSDISFQPRLPPSATLLIRKLNDPMPGLLNLDTSYPRAPEVWRHAFNTRFEQLVSTAVRPAHGPVSDSAESVVFYDYSELLASLTADWCSGSATSRWWWQALLKRGDLSQLIRELWREKIEYVPPALEQLVRRNALVEFVSRLHDDEVRVLVQRVVQVFALHEMRRVVEPRITRILEPDLRQESRMIRDTPIEVVVPWRQVVPESAAPRLRPAQQLFVGVALMIRRAPSRVRTVAFAQEVFHWQERALDLRDEREPFAMVEEVANDEPQTPDSIVVKEIVAEPATIEPDSKPDDPIAAVVAKPEREQVKIGSVVFHHEELEPVVEIELKESNTATADESEDLLVHTDQQIETAQQASATHREPLDAITIETNLGGLFYLINLAIFLNIYSDFTSPVEHRTTDLSIWDFIALVGAEINGEVDEDDPVWQTLHDLQETYPDHPIHPAHPVQTPAWLVDLLPYLHTRLRQALGIDTHTNLAHILLHHYARVVITATHIDVFFSLAEHPIEIRLSGLDRNPGWVPAAGRFIAFHYD